MTAAPRALCEEARALGEQAARAAATWVTDGNTSEDHYRRLLAMLAAGDPQADDFLPVAPDLSGQWADVPTPLSLARELTGEETPSPAVIDALAQQWEDGVDDTYRMACEAQLRAAVAAE